MGSSKHAEVQVQLESLGGRDLLRRDLLSSRDLLSRDLLSFWDLLRVCLKQMWSYGAHLCAPCDHQKNKHEKIKSPHSNTD